MNEKQLAEIKVLMLELDAQLASLDLPRSRMNAQIRRLIEERERLLAGLEGLLLDVGVTASDPKDPSLTIGESRALVAIAFAEESA